MLKKKVHPEIAVSDEAAYWEQNEDAIVDGMEQAAREGTLMVGTRGTTAPITIRLDRGDLELARAQAAKEGMRYQTYLRSLIHRALVGHS